MMMNSQATAVVTAAKKHLGYKEGTNNDTIFGTWAGMNHQPWCAMFISYVFNEAGCLDLIKQNAKGFASCIQMDMWAHKNGMTASISEITAGDILLFDFAKAGHAEHTEIALGPVDPHTHLIPTIGGNTADSHAGNQANGDGVYLKFRAPSTVRTVVKPKWSK
jgi:hypothetical protein